MRVRVRANIFRNLLGMMAGVLLMYIHFHIFIFCFPKSYHRTTVYCTREYNQQVDRDPDLPGKFLR